MNLQTEALRSMMAMLRLVNHDDSLTYRLCGQALRGERSFEDALNQCKVYLKNVGDEGSKEWRMVCDALYERKNND